MALVSLYLLDTNIIIDIYSAKKSLTFIDKVIRDSQSHLGVSVITVAEFFAGGSAGEHRQFKQWLSSGELTAYMLDDVEIAVSAGELRKKEGLLFADALILAQAIGLKACLVSNDIDFCNKARRHVKTVNPLA